MKAVFDTSVVIAILNEEKGADIGERYMSHAMLSIVNLAEVVSVLARHCTEATIQRSVRAFENKVMPFDKDAAMQTGLLLPHTKDYGLSLGDRACLALAMQQKVPVFTADTIWKELETPLKLDIQLIR